MFSFLSQSKSSYSNAQIQSEGKRSAISFAKGQPALFGLTDGYVSALAPLFAAVGLANQTHQAFLPWYYLEQKSHLLGL